MSEMSSNKVVIRNASLMVPKAESIKHNGNSNTIASHTSIMSSNNITIVATNGPRADPITPTSLANMSHNDYVRICEYIQAIEQENQTKVQEIKTMSKWLDNLSAQISYLQKSLQQSKQLQSEYLHQLNIQRGNNAHLSKQLASLSRMLSAKQNQLVTQNNMYRELQELFSRNQHQYKCKLEKLIKDNRVAVVQVNNRNNQQIEKIIQLNIQANNKYLSMQEKYKQCIKGLQQQNYQLSQSISSLTQQLAFSNNEQQQIKNQCALHKNALKEQAAKLQQLTNQLNTSYQYKKLERDQLQKAGKQLLVYKQNIKNLEDRHNGLHTQYLQVLAKCENSQKLVEKLKKQIKSQGSQHQSKNRQLQQFIGYIKTTIVELQLRLQDKSKQVDILKASNTKLREQILFNLCKNQKQQETIKDKQLRQLRLELAMYKGRLAEKEKQLINSETSSRVMERMLSEKSKSRGRLVDTDVQGDLGEYYDRRLQARQRVIEIQQPTLLPSSHIPPKAVRISTQNDFFKPQSNNFHSSNYKIFPKTSCPGGSNTNNNSKNNSRNYGRDDNEDNRSLALDRALRSSVVRSDWDAGQRRNTIRYTQNNNNIKVNPGTNVNTNVINSIQNVNISDNLKDNTNIWENNGKNISIINNMNSNKNVHEVVNQNIDLNLNLSYSSAKKDF